MLQLKRRCGVPLCCAKDGKLKIRRASLKAISPDNRAAGFLAIVIQSDRCCMHNGQIGIGVVGYGYWGPNLVRNFSSSEFTRVFGVSDLDPGRLAVSERLYPDIATTSDFQDLLRNPKIDAVVIATPVHTHYDLALSALKAGKHVLVEKPLAPTSEQVRRLIDEAARQTLTLMVDHTFLYTPAVQKIRELLHEGTLGGIYYYDS